MTPREFALKIVTTLQQANYQALWAGGCVRDQLTGKEPKDYDVATSATPEQVREVFGHKRTLPIGASFGVITVLGPRSAGAIEVATFRRDTGYSDGRRPDSVEFTDAREDALRRDFTINGMFIDPVTGIVLDYVGGQDDLQKKRIRAIGNPHDRIEEDKLRMLRGIRFAATFDFELELATLAAIKKHAPEINVVSGERIGAEMRRMLACPNRAQAVQLLRHSGLLAEILDEGNALYDDEGQWQETLATLNRLEGDFESAASVLLEPIILRHGIDRIFEQWKLSNDERKSIEWICQNWQTLDQADQLPWSTVQPLLLKNDAGRALAVATAKRHGDSAGVTFCRQQLKLAQDQLDPPPFLDGSDLIKLGIAPGPQFSQILEAIRRAQLDGEIGSTEQAVELARQMAAE